MRRLVYLLDAQDNLKEIGQYLYEQSLSRPVARGFVRQLTDQCEKIARYATPIGRERPELGSGLRSYTYKSYIIFFRYIEDAVEIVNVLHGHRDLQAFFERKRWDLSG